MKKEYGKLCKFRILNFGQLLSDRIINGDVAKESPLIDINKQE